MKNTKNSFLQLFCLSFYSYLLTYSLHHSLPPTPPPPPLSLSLSLSLRPRIYIIYLSFLLYIYTYIYTYKAQREQYIGNNTNFSPILFCVTITQFHNKLEYIYIYVCMYYLSLFPTIYTYKAQREQYKFLSNIILCHNSTISQQTRISLSIYILSISLSCYIYILGTRRAIQISLQHYFVSQLHNFTTN